GLHDGEGRLWHRLVLDAAECALQRVALTSLHRAVGHPSPTVRHVHLLTWANSAHGCVVRLVAGERQRRGGGVDVLAVEDRDGHDVTSTSSLERPSQPAEQIALAAGTGDRARGAFLVPEVG